MARRSAAAGKANLDVTGKLIVARNRVLAAMYDLHRDDVYTKSLDGHCRDAQPK
jgi:hypothetical protein